MKITQKIRMHRDAIRKEPNGPLSQKIQRESVAAIMKGIGSPEWEAYMKNFHSNAAQLARLTGKDDEFMKRPDEYGPTILAYIAGGGPCGGGTALSLAADLPFDLRLVLDDVDSDTRPDEIEPLSSELTGFLEDTTFDSRSDDDEA